MNGPLLSRRRLIEAGVIGGGLAASTAGPARAQTDPTPVVPASPDDVARALAEHFEVIDLWPKGAPEPVPAGLAEQTIERAKPGEMPNRARKLITRPRLEVIRPAQPNGAALLIMPGGGYRYEVIDKEGYDVARWYAARGVTGFVLSYRFPPDGWASGADAPLADAQRAMRMIRAQAGRFGIDPTRIAAMGFSAGGHLCANLAAQFTRPTYKSIDAADGLTARPCIAAPIYAAILMDQFHLQPGGPPDLFGARSTPEMLAQHTPSLHVPDDAPPHWLLHAEDDPTVPVANALALRQALKDRKIPVQTHLFEKGGHGFAIRFTKGTPLEVWPELFLAYARTHAWIPA
ncbi:alpha/beta hydrolase [Novosphingobium sp.]|uniref:alpha/beta hydrolase n=1 Tax=Novosphingobium sp. TaxID=1874826 RepID=UPI0025E325FF|nr:alpha/beta hydrolase [Novosphingobium sp.]